MLFLGAGGYAFAMLLLYVFNFSAYEAVRLASIYRYINTYWFAVFALLSMLYLYIDSCKTIQTNQKISLKAISIILLALWVIVFDSSTLKNFMPAFSYNSPLSTRTEDANIINTYTADTDSIYIIDQGGNGYNSYSLVYLTLPRTINTSGNSLGAPYSDSDVWTWDASLQDWCAMYLIGIIYIYIVWKTNLFQTIRASLMKELT